MEKNEPSLMAMLLLTMIKSQSQDNGETARICWPIDRHPQAVPEALNQINYELTGDPEIRTSGHYYHVRRR